MLNVTASIPIETNHRTSQVILGMMSGEEKVPKDLRLRLLHVFIEWLELLCIKSLHPFIQAVNLEKLFLDLECSVL